MPQSYAIRKAIVKVVVLMQIHGIRVMFSSIQLAFDQSLAYVICRLGGFPMPLMTVYRSTNSICIDPIVRQKRLAFFSANFFATGFASIHSVCVCLQWRSSGSATDQ